MNNIPAYFITVFSKCELDNLGYLDTGASRCWGFYYDLYDAVDALNTNATDMRENLYNYAIIEKYYPGISNEETSARLFFEWNEDKQGFYTIPEPKMLSHFCSFAIS